MSMDVSIQKQINRDFYLDVAFQFSSGSLGILGASGCGKSMTLKCIVGVEKPNHGHIIVDDKTLYNDKEKVNVKIQDRQLGYLFQHYALFPRMTVMQNVMSGVKMPKKLGKQKAMEWLERFELKNLANRYPAQLSGGQQQRVALARMLMSEPHAIFLDEPFSALDTHLREQMQFQLINIMKEQKNIIMVTHSRDEAYKLCDQLLLIDEGHVIGFGKTKELFSDPKTVSIAKLTGCKNISRIERMANQVAWAIDWGIALHTDRPILDEITHIGIRAHDFVPATQENKENMVNINVQGKIENPFEWDIIFRHDVARKDVIWWQFSKYEKNQWPEKLYLPPEKLLLLRT